MQEAMSQLNQCQQEIKWTNSPKVYIEIAILSIASSTNEQASEDPLANSDTIASLTSQLGQLEKEIKLLTKNLLLVHRLLHSIKLEERLIDLQKTVIKFHLNGFDMFLSKRKNQH